MIAIKIKREMNPIVPAEIKSFAVTEHLFRMIIFLKNNNSKNGIAIKNPYP